jgi:hypothetical protein
VTNREESGGRMRAPIQEDLHFDLAGTGVEAQLTTGGPAGPGGLALDLNLQGKPHAFATDEIAVKETGIGTLVTVVVEQANQAHQTDFSLLVPALVVDPQFNDPESVEVLALKTRHDDPPPGPFPPFGQFQRHGVVELQGTATLIKRAPALPCAGWSAVEASFAGPLFSLTVSGTCEVPRPGYIARLRRAAGQDSDSGDDLRLQLTIYEPTKTTPEEPTTIGARYHELSCSLPKTVTILPDGVSIPVQHEEGPFSPPSECDNWTVTLDPTLDPEEFVLSVEATCPPEVVGLQRSNRRGDNPNDLWLQETRTPTAPAAETPTPNRIRYKQRTRVAYTRIIIVGGGPCLPVTRHQSIPDQ